MYDDEKDLETLRLLIAGDDENIRIYIRMALTLVKFKVVLDEATSPG